MRTPPHLVRKLSAALQGARRFFVSNDREQPEADDQLVKQTLASMGALLLGVVSARHHPPELAILRGLELARRDGTVFRVLPLVLLRSEEELDWSALIAAARDRKVAQELGLLASLAAKLAERPSLALRVAELKGWREPSVRYYPEVRSTFERKLAEERSPGLARDWGFLVNVSEDSLRSTIQKHGV